ncbi:pyridoxamine 5'-phosphate oxidase family protein [Paenibacillus mesotrionivorans]|uniref:Pyridoxamine 5'-phosphate oxidase family protein n=1 Tax=Paenibacillus mesotrionivorans TaxID=3160968 RepID=A0ACC7NY60_9BACL
MMETDVEKKALSLVERSPNVVVGSIGEDGFPNMKMMFNARFREGMSVFYFSTNTSSRRTAQFNKRPQAGLYFADEGKFNGLMLLGTMEVLHDQEFKDLIWHEGDEIYYPLGRTDPDYCVYRFTAQKGRYYDQLASTDFEVPLKQQMAQTGG